MITIVLCAIVGFCIGYFGTRRHRFRGPNAFLGTAVGGCMGVLMAFMFGIAFTGPEDFEKQKSETKIVSLQSNTSVSGSFFLGTGSFEGKKVYYYYVETKRGAISRKVDADETYVKEVPEPTNPRIVKVRHKKSWSPWHFTIKAAVELEDYNQVIIPEGSIKHEFKPN
jgi:hypothetical protein